LTATSCLGNELLHPVMLIRIGYDISVRVFNSATILFLLRVHPSRESTLLTPDKPRVEPRSKVEYYRDTFNNHWGRLAATCEAVSLKCSAIIEDSGLPDTDAPKAEAMQVANLPPETLGFLAPSRFCEVDSELMNFAWQQFGAFTSGWAQTQAVCNFVHDHLRFDYQRARSDRTGLDAFREKVGVCRDFTHLAITLCRCLNIPARYVTGYLGDIGVPPLPDPMDFSAWFEVYLGGHWYSFDARHNQRRIGRIVIGRGRDAADVPIITSFGRHRLEHFEVMTNEVSTQEQPNSQIDTERAEEALEPLAG
jgi:transglutaminase-like putative cysteine protease